MTRICDLFPAKVEPLPEGVPSGMKIRAVGFSDGFVLIWSDGTPQGILRLDVHGDAIVGVNQLGGTIAGHSLAKGPGCTCGSRAVRSAKVNGLESLPLPEPEPELPTEAELPDATPAEPVSTRKRAPRKKRAAPAEK